ncbi:hypothetical protein PF008_g18111 [Phytophthora fragariae]|uniref:Uncharacterized protein n=1 Tax=Phytophthora fragariae TaxID=53985 RepID=A0A6G0R7F7_9STRA|nr:hypothetical protein PF008_g18111 [Phytophthora fragariae]
MPFLAIDLPTEEGGSDYEFLGSDSSSSGDDSDVGSTHSGVLSPCVSPASGSSAVSAAPPDRAKSDFRPPATAPGPAVPPSLSPVVGSNGSGAGSAAAIPISGEPESSSPVVDPKGSGAEPETTSAPQTPKSPVISEDSDAIFDASDDEPSQANAPGSSPADSDEPDAIFDDSDDERLRSLSPDPDLTLDLVLALAAEVLLVFLTMTADPRPSPSSWIGVTRPVTLLRASLPKAWWIRLRRRPTWER